MIRQQFIQDVGYEPNIDKPKTFNEKIQWLKLYYRNRLITIAADKYKARHYVESRVGHDILTKLHGVYKDAKEIDFNNLPDKFVMKSNNSSGSNLICRDKSSLDIAEAEAKTREWLKPESNHYNYSYEWSYKYIRPRVICEEYLEEPESSDIADYKFMCFNGKAELLFVCNNRSEDLRIDFLDMNWQHLQIKKFYPNSKVKPRKPVNFKRMIKIAEKLAKPFPFVRVDLYNLKGRIVFGELTFYPDNGLAVFRPSDWDLKLGELLDLPPKSSVVSRLNLGIRDRLVGY